MVPSKGVTEIGTGDRDLAARCLAGDRDAFEALVPAGVRVTSVHPMFGPDTELLSGRHVIFVDVGARNVAARTAAFSSAVTGASA